MLNKILLLTPPYIRKIKPEYAPLGIGYIASYLLGKKTEAEVRLVDFTTEEFSDKGWQEKLQSFDPDIVGISILTLNCPDGMLIAKLTKQFNPKILVVVGGVHATMKPEECLEYCDVVVCGEGEQTFYELVQGCALGKIKGISYKNNGKIYNNEARERIQNLDTLPFPAYHLYQVQKYEKWGIAGSRGCPYNCIFCTSPALWGRIVRFRSPENIVNEIEYLHNNFGVTYMAFHEDAFNLSQRRAFGICEEIIKRGLHEKMEFEAQLRANRECVSSELFERMKAANFVRVVFGVESGSQEVLNSIRKSITVEEAENAIGMSKRSGIKRVSCFFMIGNWNEGVRDVFKSWRFIFRNKVDTKMTICTPLPGSDLERILRQEGYLRGDIDRKNFDWATPITRTNKLSRWSIFFLYALSIFFVHLTASFSRRGEPKRLISSIAGYALYKTKRILGRSPYGKFHSL
jgi:radical SAM superfamily enzyme YgiQ (UPF0313 family)